MLQEQQQEFYLVQRSLINIKPPLNQLLQTRINPNNNQQSENNQLPLDLVSKIVIVLLISNAQLVDQMEMMDQYQAVHAWLNHHAQIVLWENFLNHIMISQPLLLKKMLKLKINQLQVKKQRLLFIFRILIRKKTFRNRLKIC